MPSFFLSLAYILIFHPPHIRPTTETAEVKLGMRNFANQYNHRRAQHQKEREKKRIAIFTNLHSPRVRLRVSEYLCLCVCVLFGLPIPTPFRCTSPPCAEYPLHGYLIKFCVIKRERQAGRVRTLANRHAEHVRAQTAKNQSQTNRQKMHSRMINNFMFLSTLFYHCPLGYGPLAMASGV